MSNTLKRFEKVNSSLETRKIFGSVLFVTEEIAQGSCETRYFLRINPQVGVIGDVGIVRPLHNNKGSRMVALNKDLSLAMFTEEFKYSTLVNKDCIVELTISQDETLYDVENDKPWMTVSNIRILELSRVVVKPNSINESVGHKSSKSTSSKKTDKVAICSLSDLLD